MPTPPGIGVQNSPPEIGLKYYYLGREQSFDDGFRVQFSIFLDIGFEIGKFQPRVAFKKVA